ncbi:MAG: LytR C-terminal domain-containing protein [Microgenomates group bacterium]
MKPELVFYWKILLYIFLGLLFIGVNCFLYLKYQQQTTSSITTPTPSPSPSLTPTNVVQKQFSALRFSIQNGSGKTGYALATATQFKAAGLLDITTSNAPSSDYTQSELIFQSSELKNLYTPNFISIFPVPSSNITVDQNQSFDVVLILGTN